jgi:hypothetical protein
MISQPRPEITKEVLKRNDIQKNYKRSQWSVQCHGPLQRFTSLHCIEITATIVGKIEQAQRLHVSISEETGCGERATYSELADGFFG